MDRQIIYPGQIAVETDLLHTNRNTMISIGKLAGALFGTGGVTNGLVVGPSSPAALTVDVAPGEIYQLENVDNTDYSSLPADTTDAILKQGIMLAKQTLACAAPATAGYSINYLIQATYQDSDTGAVALPYYNASNPTQAYSGPNNTGATQATKRAGIVVVNAKAGTAATTGTQTTPSPDSGYIALASVTVANGQATIVSGNITAIAPASPQTVGGELGKSASLLNTGCVGDGSDESAKIQSVLDSGLDVYIPAGTFTATGLTLSASGVRIYGPGTIKKKAGVDGVLLTIAADDCIIDGVHFDGTASQPSLTSVNNIINVVGSRNKVISCFVNGSAGGGITIGAGFCYNVIAFNTIKSTDDNNIMISGAEANDNLILGNYCDTTTQQNNIFVTASPASTATTDYNYRNRIIGNTCLNSGDTGIEAGIHSVGVVIQGNTVKNSHNPEILLRDCVGCIVEGNHVEAGANGIATHDGIAVLLQTETDWRYRSIIKGNRITGKLSRSGIYTQDAHDLQIEGNSIEETFATVNATTGAGLVGSGIAVTASADDIVIRGNTVRRMAVGIDLNQAAQTPTHNRVTVDNNAIYDAGTGINLFQTTLADSTVRENRIGKLVSTGINTNSSSGSNSSYLARNLIATAGYSGASPTGISNTGLSVQGWFTSENSKRAAVPETQFAFTTLNAGVRRTGGTLAIEFEDGTEDAVFGVSKTATGKIAGTSNLVDSTGAAGSTGWSLLYDGSNNLILQRRAATTGASNRFFRYRFTQNSNEV